MNKTTNKKGAVKMLENKPDLKKRKVEDDFKNKFSCRAFCKSSKSHVK